MQPPLQSQTPALLEREIENPGSSAARRLARLMRTFFAHTSSLQAPDPDPNLSHPPLVRPGDQVQPRGPKPRLDAFHGNSELAGKLRYALPAKKLPIKPQCKLLLHGCPQNRICLAAYHALGLCRGGVGGGNSSRAPDCERTNM